MLIIMHPMKRFLLCWLIVLSASPAFAQTGLIQGTRFDVDIYGNMYVLDGNQNTLRLYDKSGRLVREIGGPGWLDSQFDRPAAVWARNGIDVFVSDYGNHRVERFDRGLNFVSSFSTHDVADPDLQFGYPTGLALSRLGELYICDTENNRVVKVDRFSTVERTFGGIGAGGGRLIAPVSVELGPHDAIYVLDGQRIAVFDPFGNYLRDLFPSLISRPSALFAGSGVIAVIDGDTLYMFDGNERLEGAFPLGTMVPPPSDVRALALGAGTLYMLTAGGLMTFPDPRRPSDIENNPISH